MDVPLAINFPNTETFDELELPIADTGRINAPTFRYEINIHKLNVWIFVSFANCPRLSSGKFDSAGPFVFIAMDGANVRARNW